MSNNHNYHDNINHTTDEVAIVSCETSQGMMKWELYRDWSPIGYDRLVSLIELQFYDTTHFFRVVPNFLIQFGISYLDSYNSDVYRMAHEPIHDDPQHTPPIPFTLGTISYAGM